MSGLENSDPLGAAEAFLHRRIPLTRLMGVRVVPSAKGGFAIEAPVSSNSNHLSTAFGGSINAVATLAGYAFLWLELRESVAHVVIRESSIRFLRPVRETIRALCATPPPEEWQLFRAALQAKGKARISLRVRVEEHSLPAAEFEGTFVAFHPAADEFPPHP